MEAETKSSTNPGTPTARVAPQLSVKWGQNEPYNKYYPIKDGLKCPTGCVITATAQILSYFQTIGSVQWSQNGSYGSANLNWSRIISDSQNGADYGVLTDREALGSSIEVAHLMRYLAISLDADYGSQSTGAESNDAVKWMRSWGGLSTTNLENYNTDKVINALLSGKSIYMRANARYYHVGFVIRKYVDGHAWVIDGFEKYPHNRSYIYYVHCNMGWDGDADGYYLNDVFTTDAGPEFIEEEINDGGTSSYNFRYKKEISIVGR
ncbi:MULTISPECIES: C10 family peptidase [unclassified Parabacteroides]|uniref:C10 family peptidase n=1 Tax=unclassified Parabacteroides TaxID=2649774 RepID=UPI0024768E8E|nr:MULTISPECIES: C10 family peptidase [unclassified Parabacteroides]